MRIVRGAGQEIIRNWLKYLIAIGLVALATWLKYLAEPKIIPADVPILYIMAIVPAAIFLGLGPAILVCILSLLAYDYYFIPPLHSLDLTSVQEAPIEFIFLLVGVIISYLSSNLRHKNQIANREIIARKKTEAELVKYEKQLEELVQQRTAELEKTNLELRQEVQERKQAEELLRQSEQRWATTLSSIGDGVIATDVDGKIVFMNSVAEMLTGWALSEARHKQIAEVFHIINEASRQKVEDPVEKVLRLGTICGLANHTILLRKDATELAIDDSAAPIKTADDQMIGVVLIFRDITERKKAEEAIQTTLSRFYAVLSALPLGILMVSNEDTIEFANQAFCDLFKLTELPGELKDLASALITGKISTLHLDPPKAVERIDQIIDGGERVSEEDILMADGRILIRDFIPIHLGRNRYGRLWVYRDVTERRQYVRKVRESEQRFRLALRNAPVSIAAQDRDLRFIWAYNQRTIDPDEVIGKTDIDLFEKSDAEYLLKLKRYVLASGAEVRERLWVTSNGKRIYLDLFLEPLKDEEANITGVAIATVDLTDMKKAEDALQRSMERFEILSEANSLLLTAEKPERIIQTIAEKVMRHLNCDCFFNYMADDEAKKLKLNAYAGIPDETAAGIAWLDYGQAICGCAARDGCRLISENVQENGDTRAALVRSLGVQAYACHPLKIGQLTMGTLSFGTRTHTTFNEEEIGLMKTVTDQVSIAMERRISEEHISLAGQRLNAHMDNSPLAVIEFDPQFRVIRWSKAAERMFGWSETEVLGKAISEVKWVYQEDATLVKRVSDGFSQGINPRNLNINRNYRKDGTVIVCEWYNSSIYDSDGKLSSVLSQVLDITERKKAEFAIQNYALELENHRSHLEEMVRERTVELQSLSYRLIMVQEDERRAISRELHDEIGQSLTVLNLLLAKASRAPEGSKADLGEAIQTVKEVLSQVRNLSSSLHPGMLEDLGLLPTLNWYFNDFGKKTGIQIHFKAEGLDRTLAADVNITIYRIIQEALTNIVRYAEVKEASVTLLLENTSLYIRIEDKGKGFNLEVHSEGVGLRGMKERVNALKGKLKITSTPGKGSTVEAELPMA